MKTILRAAVPFFILLAVFVGSSFAQNRVLVELTDVEPRSLYVDAFHLDSRQSVDIEAVGARQRERDHWFSSFDRKFDYWPTDAWILDAQTREVVWTLRDSDTDDRSGVQHFKKSISLPEGDYEAYLACYVGLSVFWDDVNHIAETVSQAMVSVFKSERRNVKRNTRSPRYSGDYVDDGTYHDFSLIVRGDGRPSGYDEATYARDVFSDEAFVSLTDVGEEDVLMQGFELDRELDLDLYANGEFARDEQYDYGWILDADTREKVWSMDWDNSSYAGGAEKNRYVHGTVTLPAGRYAAFFATDDSHSPGDWNQVPGYDPDFWGLTLRTIRASDRSAITLFDYEHVPDDQAIVSMTRVGNDSVVSKGFTLKRGMDLRIYALGEGPSREMVDYGWIMDAHSQRIVWTMDYRDTEHAGGAEKNRLIDDVVHFDAGDYMAFYTSDGSHAWDEWNSSRPIDAEHWGLTVLPASGRLDLSMVGPFDENDDPNLLGRIEHAGDGTYRTDRFRLDRRTRVRIVAQGEGDDGDMYDYGWIENTRNDQVVWEMTYRKTKHAGGASKNRRFDGSIVLEPGDYAVTYRTDGSHSFGDWNSTPPTDAFHWGISVYRDEN